MNFPYDAVFILGPQGAGKGTQAGLLANNYGMFHWEMGGILREHAKVDPRISDLVNSGKLLSDEDLFSVVEAKLSQVQNNVCILFDGVPRRLGQAHMLLEKLNQMGRTRYLTLFLDIHREESIKRLMLRAGTEHRVDDNPEAIETRLRLYETETVPVLDYLKTVSTFHEIDGRPSIEEVRVAIATALALPSMHSALAHE